MSYDLRVSIVICSRDRADSLARTLRSMSSMRVQEDLSWEIVVVDNGSSDHTAEIVASFSSTLPVRYVFEAEGGVSIARNTGAREAKGSYICWADDDVEVSEDWLTAYLDAFSAFPDGAYFAGKVEPVFEGTPPQWLQDNIDVLEVLYAGKNLGTDLRPLSSEGVEDPYNANCAFRRDWQLRFPYHQNLGLSPRFRRLGEETAVFRAIKVAGGQGYWVPGADVRHHIPAKRQNLASVVTYQKSVGETWAALTDLGMDNFMGPPLERKGRLFRGAPVWLWRLVATTFPGQYASRQDDRLRAIMKHAYYRGALEYLVRSRFSSRQQLPE
jgi:glucosyl-dolichyl phosphate glucuronosyltransferase